MRQNVTFYISRKFLYNLGGFHVNTDPTFSVYERDQHNLSQPEFISSMKEMSQYFFGKSIWIKISRNLS